jgi:hypothetical protein
MYEAFGFSQLNLLWDVPDGPRNFPNENLIEICISGGSRKEKNRAPADW